MRTPNPGFWKPSSDQLKKFEAELKEWKRNNKPYTQDPGKYEKLPIDSVEKRA